MFNQIDLHWSLNALGVSRTGKIYAQLCEAYSEPQRYYHTAKHVDECLASFQGVRDLAQRPAEVEVALWFHDSIYDPQRDDNEERSAQWAVMFLEQHGAKIEAIRRIESMIAATGAQGTVSGDTSLVVDADLGILGACESAFDAYDRAIHAEYAWLPESRYQEARVKFLKSLLAKDSIYTNALFRERYEDQARNNIARKIAELSV